MPCYVFFYSSQFPSDLNIGICSNGKFINESFVWRLSDFLKFFYLLVSPLLIPITYIPVITEKVHLVTMPFCSFWQAFVNSSNKKIAVISLRFSDML